MQIFSNVATKPVRKESKTTGRGYFEFRVAESHRGIDAEPTWYTVRCMKDVDPGLATGDFVKVTGRLKTDFWVSRDGKPTGGLVLIAFEASKIAKPVNAAAGKEPQAATPAPGAAKAANAATESPLAHASQLVDWQD
jgi:hypothetical protein